MPSRSAELIVKVVLDSKGVDSGLDSLGKSLQRIGEFAVGNILAKGFDALTSSIKDAAAMAIEATGDWERLNLTLTTMVASEKMNESQMAATTRVVEKYVAVTNKNGVALKDNTVAIEKQELAVKNAALSLENARQAQQKFADTAKGAKADEHQWITLQNNVDKATNSLKSAEIQLQNLKNTNITYELQQVEEKMASAAGATLSWSDAVAQASPKVAELTQWITKLGIESPFTEEAVTAAFRKMVAVGMPIDEAKTMTQVIIDYGSVAGITNAQITGLARAMGEVNAKGVLQGEEIRQLVNNGMSMIVVAQAMGLSMEEFTTKQRAQEISAKDLNKALTQVWSERWAGAAKTLATNWAGLVPTLQEIKRISLRDILYKPLVAIEPVFAKIVAIWQEMRPGLQAFGAKLEPIFKRAADAAGKFLDIWAATGSALSSVNKTLGTSIPFVTKLANTFELLGLSRMYAMRLAAAIKTTGDNILAALGKLKQFITGNGGANMLRDALMWLTDHWNALMGAFKGVGSLLIAAGALSTVLGLINLFVNPITLIIGAAAALGVAWQNNWAGIRDKTKEVWDTIKVIFDAIEGWLRSKGALDDFGSRWTSVWDAAASLLNSKWVFISKILNDLKAWFQTDFPQSATEMENAVTKALEAIRATIAQVATDIAKLLGLDFEAPKPKAGTGPAPGPGLDYTEGQASAITVSLKKISDFISGELTQSIYGFKFKWEEAWPSISQKLSDTWTSIKNTFDSIIKWFEANKDKLEAFGKSIGDVWKAAKPFIEEIAKIIGDTLLTLLNRLLTDGPTAFGNLASTIEKYGPGITDTLRKIGDLIANADFRKLAVGIATFAGVLIGAKLTDKIGDLAMWFMRLSSWTGKFIWVALGLGALIPLIVGFAAAWILNLGNIRGETEKTWKKIEGHPLLTLKGAAADTTPVILTLGEAIKGLAAAIAGVGAALAVINWSSFGNLGGKLGGVQLGKTHEPNPLEALWNVGAGRDAMTPVGQGSIGGVAGGVRDWFKSAPGRARGALGQLGAGLGAGWTQLFTPRTSTPLTQAQRRALQLQAGQFGGANQIGAMRDALSGAGYYSDLATRSTFEAGQMRAAAGMRAGSKGRKSLVESLGLGPGTSARELRRLAGGAESTAAFASIQADLYGKRAANIEAHMPKPLGVPVQSPVQAFKAMGANRQLASGVVKGASPLGGLKTMGSALGGFGKSALLAIPGVEGLTGALGALGGIIAANPIVAGIAAIAAVLATLGVAYATNLFGFRDAVTSVFDSIKAAIDKVMPVIQPFLDRLKEAWEKITGPGFESMRKTWDDIKNAIGGTLEKLKPAFEDLKAALEPLQPVFEFVGKALAAIIGVVLALAAAIGGFLLGVIVRLGSEILTTIGQTFVFVWNTAVAAVSTAIQIISDVIRGIIDTITHIVEIVKKLLSGDFAGAWEEAKQLVSGIIDTLGKIIGHVAEFVGTMITNFFDAIKKTNWGQAAIDLWNGFIEGLKKIPVLNTIITWVEDNIIAPVKKALGIKSPSTIFETIGTDLIQGLINGISAMVTAVGNIIGQVWGAITGAAKTIFGEDPVGHFIKFGKDLVQGLIDGLGALLGKVGEAAAAIWDKIKGIFGGGGGGDKEKIDTRKKMVLEMPDMNQIAKDWELGWQKIYSTSNTYIGLIEATMGVFRDWLTITLKNALLGYMSTSIIVWTSSTVSFLQETSKTLNRLIDLLLKMTDFQNALIALRTYMDSYNLNLGSFDRLIGKINEATNAANALIDALSGVPSAPPAPAPGAPSYASPSSGGGGGGYTPPAGGNPGGGNGGNWTAEALGTMYTTGPIMVGERGPELLTPPRGSMITRSDQVGRVLRGGRTVIVNLYPTVKNEIDLEEMAYRVATMIASRS